jgi:thiol-disulfide isomerase/thioredoxin
MTRFRIALGAVVLAIVVLVVVTLVRPPMPAAPLSGSAAAALLPEAERPQAPDFTGVDAWINSVPLTLSSLRGHVVLIDFWTFSCVNCVRTIPHLQQLYDEYRDAGFVIVGVHSPEFDFEKVTANVEAAVQRLGITYPVAVDSQMATWNAYGNQYWPAEYLLDQQGRVAYTSIGEGDYDQTAAAVAELLQVKPAAPPSATAVPADITPELYAGSERGQLAGEQYGTIGQPTSYPDPGPPSQPDTIQVTGTWTDEGQYLVATQPGQVRLQFHADSLYVVAGTMSGQPLSVGVTIDGRPVPASQEGPALTAAGVSVTRQDLYHVLIGVSPGYHLLDLSVPAGFELYTFTFG